MKWRADRPPMPPATGSRLHPDSGRNRLIGIAMVSAAVFFFSILDTCGKWLVQSLPLAQVVFLRFLGHTVFTAAVMVPNSRMNLLRTRRPWLQLLRAMLLPTMTAMNFWSLQYLQLAETGAIMFLAPIIVAFLGVHLLGEKLDTGRWIAIVVGFIGVVIILQPGSRGFHPAMLVSVAQTVMYAGFILLTRLLVSVDRAESTNFLSALGSTVVLAPFALVVWKMPASTWEWCLVALTGMAGGLGHYLLAFAHRYAPASTLSPFLYQQILYMSLLGYLVFSDVPRPAVVIGAVVVVGSGLYLLLKERSRGSTTRVK